MAPPRSRTELARYIDHTLLAPTATPDDVAALVAEARRLGTYGVCVSPSMLPLAATAPEARLADVKLACVCGFPSGKHTPAVKAAEAGAAVAAGADEIDLVIDIGMLLAGHGQHTRGEVAAVRAATGDAVLKVIIESAALSDAQIVQACEEAVAGGADFVKTSTGFHPAGGASTHAVALMRRTVGEAVGVKASGGIRDTATALAMLDAGATRLGLSATAAVLAGLPE